MIQNMLNLEFIFNPKSVAVMGVSQDQTNVGRLFLEPFISLGFEGGIYPIGQSEGKIMGLEIYKDINDIPVPVDYAILTVPSHVTLQLLKECIKKGVKVVSIFTAGFKESRTEEGHRLEEQIAQIAQEGKIRIIGPNCLGLYCPKTRLSFIPDAPLESGNIGFISQSGGNSVYMIRAGASRGLRFSKVISYGNGCDLNESDFLHYLTNDEETKIICVYIEGVKDGILFRQALRKASRKKPVILLKGGSTKDGDRIIMAHTGSMKSNELIWEALLKQNGILQVHSMEEMVDIAVALTFMESINGKRAGIVGWGGGASVMAVDECTGEGLEVPTFSEEIQQQLRKFSPRAGSILLNPVDSVSWVWNQKDLFQTILTVADWPGIDFIIMHLGVTGAAGALSDTLKILPHAVDTFIKAKQACNKPMAVVLHSSTSIETDESFLREEQKCIQAGLATFPSIIRAARAINRLAEYTLRK